MRCFKCNLDVDDSEIVRNVTPPICVECRTLLKEQEKTRAQWYSMALSNMGSLNNELLTTMDKIEYQILKIACSHETCNSRIARILGIGRTTLLFKLAKYSLRQPDPHSKERKEKIPVGASFFAYGGFFESSIVIKKEKIYLGRFETKEDAYEMYRIARTYKKHFSPGLHEDFIAFLMGKCNFKTKGKTMNPQPENQFWACGLCNELYDSWEKASECCCQLCMNLEQK